jgi:hypothetical protein
MKKNDIVSYYHILPSITELIFPYTISAAAELSQNTVRFAHPYATDNSV